RRELHGVPGDPALVRGRVARRELRRPHGGEAAPQPPDRIRGGRAAVRVARVVPTTAPRCPCRPRPRAGGAPSPPPGSLGIPPPPAGARGGESSRSGPSRTRPPRRGA